jgi:hypothetical protein
MEMVGRGENMGWGGTEIVWSILLLIMCLPTLQ